MADEQIDDDDFNYLWRRREEIRTKVLANLLYQLERQKIMERRDNFIKFFSIISGTAIFAEMKAGFDLVKYLGALVAIFGICSFVFSFSAKGRDGAKRAAQWNELNKQIESKGERNFTEEDVSGWYAKTSEIEHGEPAANHSLLLKSYERACVLTGSEAADKRNFWQRIPRILLIP